MTKLKLAMALFAAILVTILVIQNTDEVATDILFFTVKLPRALLFALVFASGVVVGLWIAYSLAGWKSKAKSD